MSGAISKPVSGAFRRAREAAIPLAALSISAWSETYRYLAAERSNLSGRWRNDLTPYLVEIMDTVGAPGVREIVFVKSAQVGGSELLNNVVGYYMHVEASPILYIAETEEKAAAWSKESLAPTIRDTPVLAARVRPARQRDAGNTIYDKSFPGGHLAIAWATSPATLSSRPRRVVLMDERDAFPTTKEGDPAKLAEKRAVSYRDRKVIIKVSTPRDRMERPAGSNPEAPRFSPIELEYENSDKRRYHVPCPHCGEFQHLKWSNLVWDEDPLAAEYLCERCACLIEHAHKGEMLARGRWVAEKSFNGRAGFHINELYSPFVSWGEMAAAFVEAKKNPAALKVFVNTSLAEGWEDMTEQARVSDLTDRREDYELVIPEGVVLLTFGADVQHDRVEVEVVGWGLDDESWSIDYRVFEGDPALAEVWQRLEQYLGQEFPCEWGGTMRAAAGAVDTGGHHTQHVYRFCRRHRGRRYYAVKGANTPGKPLAPLKPTLQGSPPVPLYTVGTETAKDTLSNHLAVAEAGPGFCHFPTERADAEGRVYYGEDYFKQLRSERAVTRGNARVWQKIRASARNEALDCRVYAMAAKAILKPDLRALAARITARAAAAAVAAEGAAQEATAAEEAEEEKAGEVRTSAPPRRPRRGGYVNSFKEW